jgi:hypothetical protein
MAIKKYTKKEIEKMEDKTDYERVKNMSDEEIEKNAQEDSDSLPPTDEQMKKFKKVRK